MDYINSERSSLESKHRQESKGGLIDYPEPAFADVIFSNLDVCDLASVTGFLLFF